MRNFIDLLKNIDKDWLMDFLFKALLIEAAIGMVFACFGFIRIAFCFYILTNIDLIAMLAILVENRRKK